MARGRGGGGRGRGGGGGGAGRRGGRPVGRGRGKGGDPNMGMRTEDFDDEIDEFHKQRDKISLEGNAAAAETDSEVDEDVYGIEAGEESTDNSDEEDAGANAGDDDEVDLEEDDDDDEYTAKLKKQARAMKQRAALEAMQDEDAEEDEEPSGKGWGKSKQAYYDAEDLEETSDEEAKAEEEAEVRRLQKEQASRLRPEDYGQDDDSEPETSGSDDSEHEQTLQDMADQKPKKVGKKGQSNGSAGIDVETVTKDLASLTQEEKMAAVMSDAPELLALLAELKKGLDELREQVQPVLDKVKAGGLAMEDGLSFLEAKHLLLLSYCTNLVFYFLLKAEGRSVKDHPVITRLVQIRTYLEKVRPIDKKLQYQIDKLLAAANDATAAAQAPAANGSAAVAADDPLRYRPNPSALVSRLAENHEDPDAVYRPPKMMPMAMDGPDKKSRAEIRSEQELRRRASRSTFVKSLAAELTGAPEEVRDAVGAESQRELRIKKRLDQRAEAEENMFVRLPISKQDKKQLKAARRGTSVAVALEDFEDDVADIVGMAEALQACLLLTPLSVLLSLLLMSSVLICGALFQNGRPADGKRAQLGLEVADAAARRNKDRGVSGDADIPFRDDLGERRRKHEQRLTATAAKRGAAEAFISDEEPGASDGEASEDEVYKQAQEQSRKKKQAKQELYAKPANIPMEEDTPEGKRGISYQISKNKGLTPHRRKDAKNPRKKLRGKFAKAVVRRKGAVREVRGQSAPYGGEATGIKSNVTRGIKF
eukprot:jgi/Chlat1/665/Chrsp104S01144